MPTLNNLLLPNRTLQARTIPQTAPRVQNLGDTVIGKGSYLVYVIKLAVAFTIERGPYVSHADLGAFKEPDGLAILETHDVIEGGEVLGEDVHERCG
jgi:hypothetical protein